MLAVAKLIRAWREVASQRRGPFVLAKDDPLIPSQAVSEKEWLDKGVWGTNNSSLHLGLLPQPYVGDIRNAKIILLMQNPGFSELDYHAERDPFFARAIRQNLRQDFAGVQWKFMFLNPDLAWTGGGRYWRERLLPLIHETSETRRVPLSKAARLLSDSLAVVEYFPYHSKQLTINTRTVRELESWKLVRDFVIESTATTILVRGKVWRTISGRKFHAAGVNSRSGILTKGGSAHRLVINTLSNKTLR